MGSLYSPPLKQYAAASGVAVFIELNWGLTLWIVKKIEKKQKKQVATRVAEVSDSCVLNP